MSQLLDAIKQAIDAGDKSRYRIAVDTGIEESALSRLMSGERGLSIEAAEKLADYLGIDIIIRPRASKRRRPSKG